MHNRLPPHFQTTQLPHIFVNTSNNTAVYPDLDQKWDRLAPNDLKKSHFRPICPSFDPNLATQ